MVEPLAPPAATGPPARGKATPPLAANGPVVSARGLVKDHGRGRAARRVLDGADLDVHPGELVAITGRSGSGKSTLLALLGGLDRPGAGRIEIAGHRLDGLGERALTRLRRAHIGYVFQAFHLVPELSGRENVLLAARVAGDGRGGRRRNPHRGSIRRGERLIDELDLRVVADRRPHELSGGEQQRFAIARALVNDPELVLADEPTGNLDEASGDRVLELLGALVAGGRRAVVLVTHEPAATAAASRRLTLEGGQLRAAP